MRIIIYTLLLVLFSSNLYASNITRFTEIEVANSPLLKKRERNYKFPHDRRPCDAVTKVMYTAYIDEYRNEIETQCKHFSAEAFIELEHYQSHKEGDHWVPDYRPTNNYFIQTLCKQRPPSETAELKLVQICTRYLEGQDIENFNKSNCKETLERVENMNIKQTRFMSVSEVSCKERHIN